MPWPELRCMPEPSQTLGLGAPCLSRVRTTGVRARADL